IIDCYPRPWQSEQIDCRVEKVNSLLGLQLTAEEIADCLERRGLEVLSHSKDQLQVRTPYWRFDLHHTVDLVEEVAQIRGLDSIPEAPAIARLGGIAKEDRFFGMEEARAQLLGLGLDEIMNYTLWPLGQCLAGSALTEENILRVSNPISIDTAYLRPNLLAGLVQVVNHNVSRNTHDLGIFEIGRVFQMAKGQTQERTEIGIALSGRRQPERFGEEQKEVLDFYCLKGLLESWLEARGLRKFRCEAVSHPAFKDGACGKFYVGQTELLVFGEAAAVLVKGIRLRYPLFLALCDLSVLESVASMEKKYQELPQFPGTARDISFVAPSALTHQKIVDTIVGLRLPLLEKVELFDIFEDEKVLGAGRRSMAYSLTFCNPERTMTDEEVNKLQERIRKVLVQELNVELR
ncbi:MAG: hypothetical protein WCT05_13175, partial [Lentisphaeria bacterium]